LMAAFDGGDCEPRGAQRVGDETGIVGWRSERSRPVLIIADHQCEAYLLREAAVLAEQQNDYHRKPSRISPLHRVIQGCEPF
jgi:hypothetical protein